MRKTKLIYCLALLLFFAGCDSEYEGKVKFYFNPPMSYHTLTFPPVTLSENIQKIYSPKEFVKIDKRFRAIRVRLVIQSSESFLAIDAIKMLSGVTAAAKVQNAQGECIFTSESDISSLNYKVIQQEPLILHFNFPNSPFTPESTIFGEIHLNISIPKDKQNLNLFTASLEFEEIRGK